METTINKGIIALTMENVEEGWREPKRGPKMETINTDKFVEGLKVVRGKHPVGEEVFLKLGEKCTFVSIGGELFLKPGEQNTFCRFGGE